MKAARKMAVAVKPIPEGYHSITPFLTVRGAARAIDFYRRAFGAEELARMNGLDGKTVMHAELKIGDSRFFLGDEVPGMECRSPQTLGGIARRDLPLRPGRGRDVPQGGRGGCHRETAPGGHVLGRPDRKRARPVWAHMGPGYA